MRSTLETYNSIDKRAVNYMDANNNIVPLLILNYDYNILKSCALDSGLIVSREKIMYDSFPRTECPYSIEKVFAATPYLKNMEQTIVTFYIGSEYYFTNNTDLPATIEVDFGDGNGYRTVSFGNTITITYPNTLEKNIITKITYSSSTLKSSSSIAASLCSGPSFPAPGAIWNITATIPYDGQVGNANAYVLFHNPSIPYLRKPLVFVEGVDFGETHYPQRNGDFGWCAFWGSQPDDYEDLTNMPSILNELHAKGYDIILLDFYDGADYIQRNSLVLVELLETIKSSPHPGTELQQTVVIGASMGGQVAKYALSYMEQNNIPTCTREYISFDSPQKGANISLGVQYLLDFLGNSFPSPVNAKFNDLLDKQINRPAAKQLVNYHYGNPSYSGTNSPNDAAILRSQFYSEIGALGYPKKSRIVAIANGSKVQIPQGISFNAGDKVFEWEWNPIACGLINVITGDVWSVNNGNKIMTGSFPANTTAFGTCLLISTAITIGGGSIATGAAACADCAILGVGFSGSTVYGPPTGLPYDNCPGGYRPLFKDIEEELLKALSESPFPLRDANVPTALQENQAFIPTISSLDINTTDLFYDVSNIDMDNPNPTLTPFEAYYAPIGNQPHVYADNTSGGSAPFGYNTTPGGNLEWGLKEILNSENRLMSPLSSTSSPNSGVFNYGRKESRFLSTLTITNSGKLYVNANLPTDYGAATPAPGVPSGTNPPDAGSTFKLETCNCENVVVEVLNTGQMILGEATPNNKAIVYFHKGSKLILSIGSKLIINDNSRLIIEEGAELIIYQGATIQLLGDNAVLEIKGDVKLLPGAVFTFTHPGTNSGYVKFSRDTPWDGLPHIIGFGGNSIELKGQNKNDKILEIAQDILQVSQFQYIDLFKIQTGKVEFTYPGKSYISVDASTRLIAAKFISSGISDGRVAVWGQPVCQISNDLFDKVPLEGYLFMYGNKLTINFTEIKNCNSYGLFTQGMGVSLFGTNFNSNTVGWSASLLTQNSIAVNGKFNDNYSFGSSILASPVEINFTSCKIKNNVDYGIDLLGPTKAKFRCGEVNNNLVGFSVAGNASLSMNTTLGGGYVDAENNIDNTILLDYAFNVDIDNGYNELRINTGTPPNAIYSTTACLNYGNCPTEIAGTLQLLSPVSANNNKWQPKLGSAFPSLLTNYPLGSPEDKFTEVFSTIDGSRLHFTDITQSDKKPCGFYDPAPCPTCPASFLEVCTTCNTINTPSFINKKTNEAVKIAKSKMDTTIINGHKQAVDMFHQILKYPISTPTEGDKFVTNIAEREMIVSLVQSIESNQIFVSDSTVAPEVLKTIEIQDDKILKANIDNIYLDRLYASIDKALINYVAKRRIEAISILDNVLTFVQPNELEHVTYIKCLIQNEQLLLSKQINQLEFLNSVSLCVPPNRNIQKKSSFISDANSEEEIDEYHISLFPNPSSNQLFLEYNLSGITQARFIVYDITGKVLFESILKGGSRTEEIKDLQLSNGIYLYKIVASDNNILKQSKLTIIK